MIACFSIASTVQSFNITHVDNIEYYAQGLTDQIPNYKGMYELVWTNQTNEVQPLSSLVGMIYNICWLTWSNDYREFLEFHTLVNLRNCIYTCRLWFSVKTINVPTKEAYQNPASKKIPVSIFQLKVIQRSEITNTRFLSSSRTKSQVYATCSPVTTPVHALNHRL